MGAVRSRKGRGEMGTCGGGMLSKWMRHTEKLSSFPNCKPAVRTNSRPGLARREVGKKGNCVSVRNASLLISAIENAALGSSFALARPCIFFNVPSFTF